MIPNFFIYSVKEIIRELKKLLNQTKQILEENIIYYCRYNTI